MTEQIQYVGEHLAPYYIGNLLVSFSFVSALLAAIAYFRSLKSEISENGGFWEKIGRYAFITHALTVMAIVGLMFFLLSKGWFEYYYVMQHTSSELAPKYIFAAFWEGQEGSFLIWSFWHVCLGLILLRTSGKWEAPVVGVLALIQVFLSSMVLGRVIDIPGLDIDFRIGLFPFELTRLHPDLAGMPFTRMPDYLQRIDGRGLNPALQNYWMTIHPPSLFLGFALTAVPFAYAIAGLLKKEYTAWIRPALPWAFMGVAIFGAGILMGGAWAYEALSFGGFWAWDPVENSSLVPWITLTAGAHLLLIPKRKRSTVITAFVLIIISFVLVLYSTFLTRSGVLGDASVHSFTDLGMTGQLLLFLFFFLWLPVFTVIPDKRKSQFLFASLAVLLLGLISDFHPMARIVWLLFGLFSFYLFIREMYRSMDFLPDQEEPVYSREFWMFVGALVMIVSAAHLSIDTSKPVINRLIGTSWTISSIPEYNLIQGILSGIVLLLMGTAFFLQYGSRKDVQTKTRLIASTLIALALVLLCVAFVPGFSNPWLIILTFCSAFTLASAFEYVIRYLGSKWKVIGPATAHAGFGLIILGSIISAGHQRIISKNDSRYVSLEILNPEFKNNENIMLYRGDTVPMNEYALVYVGDTLLGNQVQYQVDYLKYVPGKGYVHDFTLYPTLIMSPTMGNVADPSTKHYLTRDIFTHVTYVDVKRIELKKQGRSNVRYESPQVFMTMRGDTIWSSRAYLVFQDLKPVEMVIDDSLALIVNPIYTVHDLKGNVDTLRPEFNIVGNQLFTIPDTSHMHGLTVELIRIHPKSNEFESRITVRRGGDEDDFIIMKAVIFPGINLLWAGCFLMVLGVGLSTFRRFYETPKS